MERLPRVLPFWMMLLGIVGFFILGVLYFDVRGRETRSLSSNDTVGVEDFQPLPEPSETTGTPTITEEQVPLALPPRTPTTQTPAVAVHDCWRHEWRGNRVIVDNNYIDLSQKSDIPLVTSQTAHLACPPSLLGDDGDDISVSPSGDTTLLWVHWAPRNDSSAGLSDNTVYRVDRFSGELAVVAHVPDTDPHTYYRFAGWSADQKTVYMQSIYFNWHAADKKMEKSDVEAHLFGIQIPSGSVTSRLFPRIEFPLTFLLGNAHAVGFEWTWSTNKDGGIDRSFPAFIHRINLETGKSIRVGELLAGRFYPDPIAIDDNRVVMSDDEGAFILNIYTRATAPIRQITSSLDRLAITTDRTHIVITGPNQPFTVIPVSELPKP